MMPLCSCCDYLSDKPSPPCNSPDVPRSYPSGCGLQPHEPKVHKQPLQPFLWHIVSRPTRRHSVPAASILCCRRSTRPRQHHREAHGGQRPAQHEGLAAAVGRATSHGCGVRYVQGIPQGRSCLHRPLAVQGEYFGCWSCLGEVRVCAVLRCVPVERSAACILGFR